MVDKIIFDGSNGIIKRAPMSVRDLDRKMQAQQVIEQQRQAQETRENERRADIAELKTASPETIGRIIARLLEGGDGDETR